MKVHLTVQNIELSVEEIQEKQCLKCGEMLPADEEFFFRNKEGCLYSPCKACQAEQRAERNQTKLCCIPGCKNPRHSKHTARCQEHRYQKRSSINVTNWCKRCGKSCRGMYCSHACANTAQSFIRAYERIYGPYRNLRKEPHR